jgi:hypothetical protein
MQPQTSVHALAPALAVGHDVEFPACQFHSCLHETVCFSLPGQ